MDRTALFGGDSPPRTKCIFAIREWAGLKKSAFTTLVFAAMPSRTLRGRRTANRIESSINGRDLQRLSAVSLPKMRSIRDSQREAESYIISFDAYDPAYAADICRLPVQVA